MFSEVENNNYFCIDSLFYFMAPSLASSSAASFPMFP